MREQADRHRELRHLRPLLRTRDLRGRGLRVQTTPLACRALPNVPATGTCVDTATSASNCGACGNVCIAGEVCTASTCACVSPKQVCGTGTASVCTNTSTDPRNCGTCGTACAAGQTCASGTCQPSCAAGLTLCSGVCVDLATDPAHCGHVRHHLRARAESARPGGAAQSCTTLTCGATCCQAPTAGNSCCGTTCPYQHRNFVGHPSAGQEQSYYDCTLPFTYDLLTAQKAASVWAPNGITMSTFRSCPTVGGSLCLQVQRPSLDGARRRLRRLVLLRSLRGHRDGHQRLHLPLPAAAADRLVLTGSTLRSRRIAPTVRRRRGRGTARSAPARGRTRPRWRSCGRASGTRADSS